MFGGWGCHEVILYVTATALLNTFLFMDEEDNSVPPGDWERYFSELSAFLTGAERQLGLANDNFSEYVVDRLELFIVNISSLAERTWKAKI